MFKTRGVKGHLKNVRKKQTIWYCGASLRKMYSEELCHFDHFKYTRIPYIKNLRFVWAFSKQRPRNIFWETKEKSPWRRPNIILHLWRKKINVWYEITSGCSQFHAWSIHLEKAPKPILPLPGFWELRYCNPSLIAMLCGLGCLVHCSLWNRPRMLRNWVIPRVAAAHYAICLCFWWGISFSVAKGPA